MTAVNPQTPTPPPNAPTIGLDDAIAKMQTGDLMLFHNDEYFESELIDVVTDSWFSHVGIVFRDPRGSGVYIWQTDPGVIVRDEMGKLSQWGPPRAGGEHAGAQLGVLRDAVLSTAKSWGDQPYWRQLSYSPSWPEPQWGDFVLKQMFDLDGTPYTDGMEMPLDYFLGHEQNSPNPTGHMFCSEMIAATYQKMGLLPGKPYPNYYAPHDFSSEPGATLPLQHGATLNPEWQIVLPPS